MSEYKRGGTIALVTKDRRTSMLEVFGDSNAAIVADAPIAALQWGEHKLEVRCSTVRQYAESKAYLDGQEPQQMLQEMTEEQLAHVGRLAFGGEKCPMTEEQMLDQPKPFLVALREAVQVFFWDGPLVDLSQTTEDETEETTTG